LVNSILINSEVYVKCRFCMFLSLKKYTTRHYGTPSKKKIKKLHGPGQKPRSTRPNSLEIYSLHFWLLYTFRQGKIMPSSDRYINYIRIFVRAHNPRRYMNHYYYLLDIYKSICLR